MILLKYMINFHKIMQALDSNVVVFASGNRLVFVNRQSGWSTQQAITTLSPVTCLSSGQRHLAVGCQNGQVLIYGRDSGDRSAVMAHSEWKHACSLETPEKLPVTSLSFADPSTGDVVVSTLDILAFTSGSMVGLYRLLHGNEWYILWQQRCANPLSRVKFSPDAKLFATSSNVCRQIDVTL